MSYITYSEKDLKNFMLYSRPNITETDAFYLFLQENMMLDKLSVTKEETFDAKSFMKNYVQRGRPV